MICYNDVIAMGAWFGLIRAGRQSGEGGVETFFGHQVALGAFADVGENALDDLPIVWATTPLVKWGTPWQTELCSVLKIRTCRPGIRLWRRG